MKTKLLPCKQWVCDNCGEIIEKAKDGWFEYNQDKNRRAYGFRIVHHITASPVSTGCYGPNNNLTMHLDQILGYGLVYGLYILDRGEIPDPAGKHPGVQDVREWATLVRRLWVPYYEQARLHFKEARGDGLLDGLNEIAAYSPETLQEIIDRYA
jgi:hypothetical protein